MDESAGARQGDGDTRWVDALALLVVGVVVAAVIVRTSGVPAWRQDEIRYLADYAHKVREEGRWVNHLAFPLLRLVPPGLAWTVSFVGLGVFGALAGRRSGLTRAHAALFGALLTLSPPMSAQGYWPATILVANLLLVVAGLLADRLPRAVFFAVFGSLLFGCYQQFYFLLPLLFLGDVVRTPDGAVGRAARLLAVWGFGFVVGYAVAHVYLLAVLGQWGLTLAPWRRANPVVDVASLVVNVATRFVYLASHLAKLSVPLWSLLPLLGMIPLAFAGRPRAVVVARAAVLLGVFAVLYVVTIPIGVMLQFRTSVATYAAVLAAGFLGYGGARHRRLYAPAAAALTLAWGGIAFENATWFRGVMEAYRDRLLAVTSAPPGEVEGLLVLSGDACGLEWLVEDELHLTTRVMENYLCETRADYYWKPSALAAGFRDVVFCVDDPQCTVRAAGVDPSVCLGDATHYCVHGVSWAGWQVISIQPQAGVPAGGAMER